MTTMPTGSGTGDGVKCLQCKKNIGVGSTNNEIRNRKPLDQLTPEKLRIFWRLHRGLHSTYTESDRSTSNKYLCRVCHQTLYSIDKLENKFRGYNPRPAAAPVPSSVNLLRLEEPQRKRKRNEPQSLHDTDVENEADKTAGNRQQNVIRNPDTSHECQTKKVPAKACQTVRYLCNHQYLKAAKAVVKIKRASEGVSSLMASKVSQQSRYFCQTSKYRGKPHTSINDLHAELHDKCPDALRMLESMAKRTSVNTKARVVATAYILLNSRKTSVNSIQKTIGLLLWKGHIRSLMFRRLRLFGLCQSRTTVLRQVDNMTTDFDIHVKRWKQRQEIQENMQSPSVSLGATECIGEDTDEYVNMEVQDDGTLNTSECSVDDTDEEGDMNMMTITDDHTYGMTNDEDGSDNFFEDVTSEPCSLQGTTSDEDDNDNMTEGVTSEGVATFDCLVMRRNDEVDEGVMSEEMTGDHSYSQPDFSCNQHPGFQIIFDNVNIRKVCRHKTKNNQNEQYNLVQAYATLDRVGLEHVDDTRPILKDIRTLQDSAWWLDDFGQDLLKEEIKIMITRIATHNVPSFDHLIGSEKKIEQEFHEESKMKSNVNKLGLFNIDEMFVDKVVDLMDKLQNYCPQVGGGLQQIPFGGDGLSVMKALSAQRSRADGFTRKTRLHGLIPKPEDWHENLIILQDIYTRYYKTASIREKGTRYHLRELFDRRGVRASAKDVANDNREFVHFVTTGFVVLAVMQILGINKIDDTPSCVPAVGTTIEEKQNFLDAVATAVVDHFVFPHGVLPTAGMAPSGLDGQDSKFSYVTSLMREGLLDMARQDAIRENDGQRIIDHWKYDFIHFCANSHKNYKAISFRFLAQIHGLLSKRMAARLIYNRTVNVHGGASRNIPLDLYTEFLNKEIKEDLRRSGPYLTDALLKRIGQSKQVMDDFLQKYDQEVELYSSIGRHKKPDLSGEIREMVNELRPEALFSVQQGRSFKTFPDFKFSEIHSLNLQELKAYVTVQLTQLNVEHTKKERKSFSE